MREQAQTRWWYRLLYSQRSAPYVFVLPFILSFLLFFLYPVISTVIMSFQEVLPGMTSFIGPENYRDLINPAFGRAIMNSVLYTVLTLVVLIPLPLLLAVLLNSKRMPGKGVFRSALFMPALTSVVVAGTIFRLIFGELDGSLLNSIVSWFGIEPQKWLTSAGTGMFALIVLALWRWLGVNLLYFMSGLQNIPPELYEAAQIDGASRLQSLLRITIPLLRPVTIYVFTISIYAGLAMFTESFMLWNGNNSPNDIGLTIVGYLYRQGLEQNSMGFGAAVGIVLLVFALILNLIQLRFFGLFRKED
ncbi:sugar ABC transporter permease [Paenibacillus sp. JX-17]|uniref:Sugar ABC transporter permease n=2 Tax=Paenibacillus lacisoli TaxID=3064525 RepID=A0ABT9CE42_9BACL|nr:sugar ABC transporter permease [Paenibacillus sp. JX-17]MDO7907547.1 sugar ABC transporter permease [Paenibacillus sp. JX-17]